MKFPWSRFIKQVHDTTAHVKEVDKFSVEKTHALEQRVGEVEKVLTLWEQNVGVCPFCSTLVAKNGKGIRQVKFETEVRPVCANCFSSRRHSFESAK